MEKQFERTALLYGSDAIELLSSKRIAVFGVGGVGGYVVEVLARSGVGAIDLFDNDVVDITNLNRQIISLHSNIGKLKVEVAKSRIININPSCFVNTHSIFYNSEIADQVDLTNYDYVIDCIDSVSSKVELIRRCFSLNIPILSSMGSGRKSDPSKMRIMDISKTKYDALAKTMRKRLKECGIKHLEVVSSDEQCLPVSKKNNQHKVITGSNAFVPAAAGIVAAGHVIMKIIQDNGSNFA